MLIFFCSHPNRKHNPWLILKLTTMQHKITAGLIILMKVIEKKPENKNNVLFMQNGFLFLSCFSLRCIVSECKYAYRLTLCQF